MAVTETPFIQARPYQAVSITHFCIDVLNSGRNLLIALLAIALGLSNAQVGITLLLYNVGASLSQPLFGWLADRIGPRWLVVGGMGWMTFFFTLAALAGNWLALGALTVAGIGSGMFHPAGTMVASLTSQTARSRATAVFFFAGQMGLFMGPIVAGLALDWHGRTGYVIIPLTTLFAFAYGWLWLTNDAAGLHAEKTERAQARTARVIQRQEWIRRGIPLTIIILTSSTVSIAAVTFAPKLFTEAGYAQTRVGILSGMLMLGSALGGIVGGAWGDRIAGKWVIVTGMVGLIVPIYLYIPAAGLVQPALLLLAGFFVGMPHTILVLNVQSLFPGRRALASGLALGLMFAGGALGSYFLGLLADQIGLATALQYTAVLPIIAAFTALVLPARP